MCSLARDSDRTSEMIPTPTGTLHPVTSWSVIDLSVASNRNGSRKCQARKFKSTISNAMALNPTAKIANRERVFPIRNADRVYGPLDRR